MKELKNSEIAKQIWPLINGNKCIAWIGSGLSRVAGYPGWTETIEELCSKCGIKGLSKEEEKDSQKLIDKAEDCKQKDHEVYWNTLGTIFGEQKIETRLAFIHLMRLSFTGYITTNFDPLLCDAGTAFGCKILHSYPSLPAFDLNSNHHPIYYIHGFAKLNSKPTGKNLILASSDFEEAYGNNGMVQSFLIQSLPYFNVVFIGCSLSEPDIYKVLQSIHRFHKRFEDIQPEARMPRQIALLPYPIKPNREASNQKSSRIKKDQKANINELMAEEDERFKAIKIQVIRYDQINNDNIGIEKVLEALLTISGKSISLLPRLGIENDDIGGNTMSDFFDKMNRIDEIIQLGPRRDIFIQEIQPLFEETELKKYFYSKLEDPEWLDILSYEGVFNDTPAPIKNQKTGMMIFPPWFEASYLIKMARIMPKKVADVCLNMPATSNVRVHENLMEIILLLPLNLAGDFVPLINSWLKTSYLTTLPEKMGFFISFLAKGKKKDKALSLAKELLSIIPKESISKKKRQKENRFPPEPKSYFDTWYYEKILKNNIPDIIELADIEAITLLCDILVNAIQASRFSNSDRPEDNSFVWRPAIEDHEQNSLPGLKSLLTTTIRDGADTLMAIKGKEIFNLFLSYHYRIFLRISLYLRNKWPQIDPDGTAKILQDPELFDDLEVHHEFYHLLESQFKNIPEENQKKYLELIEGIKTIQDFILLHKLEGNDNKKNQIDGEKFIKHWKFLKLWPIRESLRGAWKALIEEYTREFEKPSHPDFHYYSGPVTMGPSSPKTHEELQSMSIDALILYLITWTPHDKIIGPDPEGLGRELTALVASNLEQYSINANRFREVKPIFVEALIRGFRRATQAGPLLQWEPVLDLCSWINDQEPKTEWSNVRKTVTELLSDGLKSTKAEIPISLRDLVWKIIKPLTTDIDPTPDREKNDYESVLAPYNISINTIRGNAILAVIHYALWISKNSPHNGNQKQKENITFIQIPEVREVLEYHLEPENDPSLAIRSIYGCLFPWIAKIDREWAITNTHKIFPIAPSLITFRKVAWETYITYCPPFDSIYDILQGEYYHAIETIDSELLKKHESIDPNKHLTEHLMTFSWQGKISFEDTEGLLRKFYEKAPEELRKHALWHVGRGLHQTVGEIPLIILERIKGLWMWRLEEVRAGRSNSSELASFGWWFASGKFDDDWSISQLKQLLEMNVDVIPDHMIIDRFIFLAEYRPLETIECLNLMIKNDKDGWRIYSWKNPIRKILSSVMIGKDISAKHLAIELINHLGSKGQIELRELLPKKIE